MKYSFSIHSSNSEAFNSALQVLDGLIDYGKNRSCIYCTRTHYKSSKLFIYFAQCGFEDQLRHFDSTSTSWSSHRGRGERYLQLRLKLGDIVFSVDVSWPCAAEKCFLSFSIMVVTSRPWPSLYLMRVDSVRAHARMCVCSFVGLLNKGTQPSITMAEVVVQVYVWQHNYIRMSIKPSY